eukprot:1095785-Alexandrium_andersonii.AAC.1
MKAAYAFQQRAAYCRNARGLSCKAARWASISAQSLPYLSAELTNPASTCSCVACALTLVSRQDVAG